MFKLYVILGVLAVFAVMIYCVHRANRPAPRVPPKQPVARTPESQPDDTSPDERP